MGRGAGAVSKGRFFTIHGFSSKLSSYPIYTTIRESILALSKHLKQRAWAEKMLTRATGGVVLPKDGHSGTGANGRETETPSMRDFYNFRRFTSHSDEAHWLPNTVMTKLWEVSDETPTDRFPHFQCL